DDYPQWIEDAIQIMELSNYYVYRFKMEKISESRGKIPCDIENLYGTWCSNDISSVPNKSNLRYLPIKNAPMIGNGNLSTMGLSQHYGTINGSYIHTSFQDGYVFFAYTGVPVDCDGYPLVPKNAKFTEAIQYYFIYRMSLSGYTH